MMNLWGFEKQATLTRMAGQFGLMQTATSSLVNIHRVDSNDTPTRGQRAVTINGASVPGNLATSATSDETHIALTPEQVGAVIEQLRAQGNTPQVGQRYEVEYEQAGDALGSGDLAAHRRGYINISPELLAAHPAGQRSTTAASATPPPPPPPPPGANPTPGSGGQQPPTNAPDPEIARQNNQARLDQEREARQQAHEEAVTARQQAREDALTARQLAAQQQQLPSAGAQVMSSILNPIAGAFGGLANAAAIASLGNSNVSAFSTPFGSSYQASGLGAVGGGYGLGNPLLASLGGVGNYGGTALSNFGGGMDILGLGNTFYGQAMDERSRARQLDAEINRLKMMIMSGNMDAILQAVTLLTLRSKSTLRNAAATMITSMQNSNRQMEVQNNRLEALSGNNTRSSQANQTEMMSINNQIQGINMDRQTAMNAVRDMMSALEEQTSTEQGIRRGFEQLRQISSWRA